MNVYTRGNTPPPPSALAQNCGSNDACATEQRLMTRAIDDESRNHTFAQHVLTRVTEFADRQLGPVPTAQDKNGVEGAPQGEIYTLHVFQSMTYTTLSRIEEQLDRLNRL